MNRYFLKIAYDGIRYHGWQLQKNAHTVQAELNRSLATALQMKVETLGCGRTDTGVHARKFYVQFDCSEEINRDDTLLIHKLNSLLPYDISVLGLLPVVPDANARFDAISRTYEYSIHQHKNPFLYHRSYFHYEPLDIERMNQAAELLLECNEFSCFSKSRTQVKTNICKIRSVSWKEEGGSMKADKVIKFRISADRFLRNMVRAIVGTMIEIGAGRVKKDGFSKIIESKKRSNAGETVPGYGLYLTNVSYPEGYFS